MKYFAGIDVGSFSAEAVLVDEAGKTAAYPILPTGNNSRKVGTEAFREALNRAGIKERAVVRLFSTDIGHE